ncbi:MAG: hypothetical protein GC168_12780 [Candidatus Hydrogenedens sp.]|nr:hypothetical protein [Candidatus Hydrogenedens sp.]
MNTFLKSAAVALCIAAAVQSFTVGYLSPRLSLEVCRPGLRETRVERFAAAPLFHLINRDGAVQVRTHSGTEVIVEADMRAYTPDSDTAAVAAEYFKSLMVVEDEADTLQIVTEPGHRPDGVELLVNYVITLPKGTNLKVEGSNGNVYVAAGCGDIAIEGNNTDIEVIQPMGGVHARAANGRIRVEEAMGSTTLETVNGSIYAYLHGGSLQASTANGNIIAHLMSESVDACDLTAMNGGITLGMAEGCSAEVNATTGGGLVRSDLLLDEMQGVQRMHALHAKIGDGRTRLTMNSLNGDILITRNAT